MISASDLQSAFPEIDPGLYPKGARVLVQLRTVREKTEGGIVLVEDSRQFNKANTQLGKMIHLVELPEDRIGLRELFFGLLLTTFRGRKSRSFNLVRMIRLVGSSSAV